MKKKKNWNLILGGIITVVMLIMILIGFFWTPYDSTKMDSANKLAAPSLQHIMGCDNFGRDIFSRVLEGMGNTFVIAILTVLIGVFFGILIGAFTGYFGGWLDEVLMRINDVVFAFPSILLALIFTPFRASPPEWCWASAVRWARRWLWGGEGVADGDGQRRRHSPYHPGTAAHHSGNDCRRTRRSACRRSSLRSIVPAGCRAVLHQFIDKLHGGSSFAKTKIKEGRYGQ